MANTKQLKITRVINHLNKLIDKNKKELNDIDFVVGVSRGGLVPAALLATRLNKPLVVTYVDKKGGVYFDRQDWIKGQQLLLVDDIVRTGKTMEKMKELLSQTSDTISTLSIYSLNTASLKPDFSLRTRMDINMPWDYE